MHKMCGWSGIMSPLRPCTWPIHVVECSHSLQSTKIPIAKFTNYIPAPTPIQSDLDHLFVRTYS